MFQISIDTSALTFSTFLIPGQTDFLDGAIAVTITLPAGIYSFQQSSGSFANFQFEVTAAGLLDYDAKFDSFLNGRGTSTLTIGGFAITLDISALSHHLLPIVAGSKDFLTPDVIHTLVLVPSSSYGFQPGSGLVANFEFEVDLNGNVAIDPKYAGFATGTGTKRVTIQGYVIEIDGRRLSHDLLPLIARAQNEFLPATVVNSLTLIPATNYGFQAGSGLVANFEFEVDLNGNVAIDPKYAGFATGTGTKRVTIQGYVIEIDGRRLSHDLLPLIARAQNEFLPATVVNSLTLIPASYYGFQPGSGIVADMVFSVELDGLVDYPSSCDGFLQGRGSALLVLSGYPVLIDATQADSDLVGLVDIAQAAQAARFLLGVLLPCNGYRIQTRNGVFAQNFILDRSGRVTVDASVAGRMVVSTVPRVEVIGTTPI
jgi:hypothetical protein